MPIQKETKSGGAWKITLPVVLVVVCAAAVAVFWKKRLELEAGRAIPMVIGRSAENAIYNTSADASHEQPPMPNPVDNADAAGPGNSNASGSVGDNSNAPQAEVVYSIPMAENEVADASAVLYSIPMAASDASAVLVSGGTRDVERTPNVLYRPHVPGGNRDVERTPNVLYRPHVPGGNRNVQRFPNPMYGGGSGNPDNEQQRVSSEL